MKADEPSVTPTPANGRRPLFWWPFTLIALTTALLLVAGRVSAWRGGDDENEGDEGRAPHGRDPYHGKRSPRTGNACHNRSVKPEPRGGVTAHPLEP